MPYSDDPVADFERHDREQTRWLERLPICDRCGHPIQQERAVMIFSFCFCYECLEECREDVILDE